MLFLVFQLGDDRYAIPAKHVIEILPLVNARPIPQAPAGVAGLFDYHGVPVPLIDLAQLAVGRAARHWMSTRIIMLRAAEGVPGPRVLGLLAEHATETLSCAESDFADAGAQVSGSRYLGPVTSDASGIIQRIEIAELFAQSMCAELFRGKEGSTSWDQPISKVC